MHASSPPRSALESGQSELDQLQSEAAALDERKGALEAEAADREGDIAALETEKELQAGGEVKELQEEVDRLAMRCAAPALCRGEARLAARPS